MNIPLWSWHEPEFSLMEGKVNWGLSEYYNKESIPKVKQAYAELKELLETDQIIWCATEDDYFDQPGRTKVGWVLSVPERDLFRIVNNVVWNQLLGQLDYFPHSLRENWTAEAKKITDLYSAEYYSQIKKRIDEYLTGDIRQQILDSLFIDAPYQKAFEENESICVLLKHPIPATWVIRSDYRNIK